MTDRVPAAPPADAQTPRIKSLEEGGRSPLEESQRLPCWLSILMPVYNVEAYLPDCFASLAAQDLTGVEVIAVDDCSTDGSWAALTAWAAAAPCTVTLLQHPHNRGVSAARNTLLDAASGDYLWFLDPDDAMAAHAVSQLKDIVARHAPDWVMCDYWRWRPDVQRPPAWERHLSSFDGPSGVLLDDGEQLFRGLYQTGRFHPWSKISKRSLWDRTLRFPEGRCFEDVVLMPQVALRARNYFYQDSVWIHYRQRPGSIISAPTLKKIEDLSVSASGALDGWLARHPRMSAAARSAFYVYCLKVHTKVIKDLIKIGQLNPETLTAHRRHFYANTRVGKGTLAWSFLATGRWIGLWKLLKVLRYL